MEESQSLEKSTSVELRKRLSNIVALRAAFFDLWQISQFEEPVPGDADIFEAVLNSSDSIDAWRRMTGHAERLPGGTGTHC